MDVTGVRPWRKFILGVNYWPAASGVYFWREFSPAVVEEDFRRLREIGMDCIRLFLMWEDFQPEPDKLAPGPLAHLDAALATAARYGLQVIVTFFIGHMSGENFDVSWRAGRPVYRDPAMLRAQVFLVREMARRYRNHPAVLAWDLANEHDNYAPLASSEEGWLWAHLLTREIEVSDPGRPVLLGTHITSLTQRLAFRPEDLGQLHDVLCVHPYPIYTDLCPGGLTGARSLYFTGFCIRLMAGLGGRPVLLEEFGVTDLLAGENEAAAFYRETIFSALINGALGALAWCYSDFDSGTITQLPYETTPHEVDFGVTRPDGQLKATGKEMQDFQALLAQLPVEEWEPDPSAAAIILPYAYFDTEETGPLEFCTMLFQAYLLARLAGLTVAFIRPEADLTAYRLLICPAATRRGYLKTSHWWKLVDHVQKGGTLYLSYNGLVARGMADVFGVEVTDEMHAPGRELQVRPRNAFPLVEVGNERLVYGHRYGNGLACLAPASPEVLLTRLTDVDAGTPAVQIYLELARQAGLAGPGDQATLVEKQLFRYGQNVYLVAVNHGPEVARVSPGPGREDLFWEQVGIGGASKCSTSLVLEPHEGGIWVGRPR